MTNWFKIFFLFEFPAYIFVFAALGISQSVILAEEKKEGNSFNAVLVLEEVNEVEDFRLTY